MTLPLILILTANIEGLALTWGSGSDSQLGHRYFNGPRGSELLPRVVDPLVGLRATSAAAGSGFTLVCTKDEIFSFGELGSVTNTMPRAVGTLSGTEIVSLAAGTEHALACTSRGECFSWGSGTDGQLGYVGPASGDVALPCAIIAFRG